MSGRAAGVCAFVVGLVMGGLPAAAALAQEAPPPGTPTFQLPEIDVAGKRPQLPSATAAAVSVITADEIAATGALTVGQALSVLPEVTVKSSGGPGSLTTVSIRGSSSTQVLILIDGVPINRPDQPSVDLSSLPVQNVERIEVLRGAMSGLYGSDTMGGVINIVTKTQPATTTSARTGSYGAFTGTLSLGGTSGDFSYLVQGITDSNAGFAPDTGYSKSTETATLHLATGDTSGWTLSLNRFSSSVGTPGPLPVADQDFMANTSENRTLAALTWQTGAIGAPGAMFRMYTFDDDAAFTSPALVFQSDDQAQLWGVQTQAVLAPFAGDLVTLGAEYQGQVITHTDNTPSEFTNTGSDLGLYVENNWQATPGTLVTLGVRDDIYQQYGSQVDPWAGILIAVTDRIAVRMAAGRSFRAPSFDELAPSFNGNPDLMPEVAWQYDAGIDYTLSPALTLHVGGYYTNAINLITSSPPLFVPENVGHAIITGGSIEIVGQLSSQWFVRANYTDQDAHDAATGLDVIYVPRQMANLELTYSPTPAARINVIESYVGDRYNDPANTELVPGYWLTSLTVTYAFGEGYTVQAGVDNSFDTVYQATLGYPEPGTTYFVTVARSF